MIGDEYQRTAEALAGETRMLDASAERIEQELLSVMRSDVPPWVRDRTRFGVGRSRWLAAAAVVFVLASAVVWLTHERVRAPNPPPVSVAVPPPSIVLRAIAAVDDPKVTKHADRTTVRKTASTGKVVRPTDFVALPWSVGLPDFESGAIVRMEMPAASLPAYGIDISPGVGTRPLEADVLIGQDGFARAIRLVTNTPRSAQ
jgi:hypothetical protein